MAAKVKSENEMANRAPIDKREYPNNGSFVGAWDYPSTYLIVGSRMYSQQALIDVQYDWGAGTNYEGHRRLTTFIFVKEDGDWRLDDVYTFRGMYEPAESLNYYFRQP